MSHKRRKRLGRMSTMKRRLQEKLSRSSRRVLRLGKTKRRRKIKKERKMLSRHKKKNRF